MIPPSRTSTTATASRRRVRRRRCRRFGGLPGGPLAGTARSWSPWSWPGAPQCGQLCEDTPAGAFSRDGPAILMASPTNRGLPAGLRGPSTRRAVGHAAISWPTGPRPRARGLPGLPLRWRAAAIRHFRNRRGPEELFCDSTRPPGLTAATGPDSRQWLLPGPLHKLDGLRCAQYHHGTVDEPAVRRSGLPVAFTYPRRPPGLRRSPVSGREAGSGARRRVLRWRIAGTASSAAPRSCHVANMPGFAASPAGPPGIASIWATRGPMRARCCGRSPR